jgi:xylulokinase
VGLSSQAQTYVALDENGKPLQPAVVWTDAQAVPEAEEAARALPDFAKTCGFVRPSPLQFLPKVMHFRRQGGQAHRFALLNEWIAFRLTGELYGDVTNQGMGGFYDIRRQTWNMRALALAGITQENLASVAPAGAYGACLKPEVCRRLSLPAVPVFSCGNDQSCAAIGAGIQEAGELFCNFGTALVIYALKPQPLEPASEDQIAGLSPIPSWWFLLGVESECGNIVEWMARLFSARKSVCQVIEAALQAPLSPSMLPKIIPIGSGMLNIDGLSVGSRPEALLRGLLEFYADRFGEILRGVVGMERQPNRLIAGGGLSRCQAWLDFLAQRYHMVLSPCASKHPGLVGVARIIRRP